MLCFWTTRGAAIFDLCMTVELLLSGRLVPMPLMPDWVQELARFLPFQWAFYFPIESLVGDLSEPSSSRGLARPAPLDPDRARDLPRRLAFGDPALLARWAAEMNAVRVSWLYFKLGVLNELQYRVNFFVSLFQAAIALVTGLVVLALVYSHTEELNGWTQSELLCVLGIQILMGGLIRTSIQPNMTRLIEDVRDGKLDFALTKPEDAQVLVSVREVRIWQAVDIVSGAIVLGVGLSRIATTSGRRAAALRRLARCSVRSSSTASGSSSRRSRSGS